VEQSPEHVHLSSDGCEAVTVPTDSLPVPEKVVAGVADDTVMVSVTVTVRVAWVVPQPARMVAIAITAARRMLDSSRSGFASQGRLERTRLLVRAGPALGLMGTLIPLSPALTGLANGNVSQLTSNLRIAFSVTVLGLLVGAVAFGLSLTRDRMYGQDLSDLQYVAAVVSEPTAVTEAHA
jgi:hypothetical protein